MIKAEFNYENSDIEMEGNLAAVMAEFVCGTISILDSIANIDEDAAHVVRNDLIAHLARYRPNKEGVHVIEKEVQEAAE